MTTTTTCGHCGFENPAAMKFCGACGQRLAQGCPACGVENRPGFKFCGECGASLSKLAAPPLAPAPAASPDLAPAAPGPAPAGERRQLTVLFCDLVGSTPLSQQLDAEEWRDIIAQYQQAASAAVARFGGHVAKNLADVPHTWLECGATPYTEGTPFHPIIALVSQGLAFAPQDTAADKLGKLEGGLRDLVSAENVALLADFLGLPPPTRLQMSPELQRRKTIDLLAQWNLSLSTVQPLVLFIEDLHCGATSRRWSCWGT